VGVEGGLNLYFSDKAARWFRIQWQFEDSSAVGVTDSSIAISHLLPGEAPQSGERSSFASRTSSHPNATTTPKFGYYLTNIDSQNHRVTTFWDDIYIDDSWARVEIGDAASYETCTHREMQPLASWSETGLSFKLNVGSLDVDEASYLYVVDPDGLVNEAGYLLNLSSGEAPRSEAYSLWLSNFFDPTEIADDSITSPFADPDRDGLDNRFEFRANLDPSNPMSQLRFEFVGQNSSSCKIYPVAADSNLHFEYTQDLETWHRVDRADITLAEGQATIDMSGQPSTTFVRALFPSSEEN